MPVRWVVIFTAWAAAITWAVVQTAAEYGWRRVIVAVVLFAAGAVFAETLDRARHGR